MAPTSALGRVALVVASSVGAALSRPLSLPQLPTLVLDTHVHISNLTLLSYPWSVPCPDTPCPAAPLCLCAWSLDDYAAASSRLPASRVVFVEVAVAQPQWLVEASWVQSLATAGDARIGAIIAQPPPGFGVPGTDVAALGKLLDQLAGLPLARGVRLSAVNFSDASVLPTVIAHVGMLVARGLVSIDIIAPTYEPGVGNNIAQLAAAVPGATFVLDHIGSPPVLLVNASLAPAWYAAITTIAKQPNVVCKVSGVLQYYKAGGAFPGVETVRPWVEHAWRSFSGRAVWECNWFFVNWPLQLSVCNSWLGMMHELLLDFGATADEIAAYFWSTGARAYRVAAP